MTEIAPWFEKRITGDWFVGDLDVISDRAYFLGYAPDLASPRFILGVFDVAQQIHMTPIDYRADIFEQAQPIVQQQLVELEFDAVVVDHIVQRTLFGRGVGAIDGQGRHRRHTSGERQRRSQVNR